MHTGKTKKKLFTIFEVLMSLALFAIVLSMASKKILFFHQEPLKNLQYEIERFTLSNNDECKITISKLNEKIYEIKLHAGQQILIKKVSAKHIYANNHLISSPRSFIYSNQCESPIKVSIKVESGRDTTEVFLPLYEEN
ncbi:MAG: hypothetical protein KAH32_02505 [Chlamydiia bacterium]|nr:hypothetical protein [Chlamydiia bacterium]